MGVECGWVGDPEPQRDGGSRVNPAADTMTVVMLMTVQLPSTIGTRTLARTAVPSLSVLVSPEPHLRGGAPRRAPVGLATKVQSLLSVAGWRAGAVDVGPRNLRTRTYPSRAAYT